MIDIDKIVDEVTQNDLTLDTLKKIVELIHNGTSFKNSKNTSLDLYILMSTQKNANAALIYKMVSSQLESYRPQGVFRILDNSNKTTFDKIWKKFVPSDNIYQSLNLFKSQFTDESQLVQVWNNYIKGATKAALRNGMGSIKADILSHNNCPHSIMNRQLKNSESLMAIARSANISDKAFKTVCDYAMVDRSTNNAIFSNLLRNKSISWDKISDGVEMKRLVKEAYVDKTSTAQKKAYINVFFRRTDAPDTARYTMYKLTDDITFLPQEICDLFLV